MKNNMYVRIGMCAMMVYPQISHSQTVETTVSVNVASQFVRISNDDEGDLVLPENYHFQVVEDDNNVVYIF